MQVRLDCSERPAGLIGDFPEGQVAEEAQRHHLAIRLVEASQCLPDVRRPLRAERNGRRIRTAGVVGCFTWVRRIEPRDGSPLLRSANRDTNAQFGSATHRTARPRATCRARGTRSRMPPGPHPRLRVGRRARDDRRARPTGPRGPRGSGTHRDRRQGRGRRRLDRRR